MKQQSDKMPYYLAEPPEEPMWIIGQDHGYDPVKEFDAFSLSAIPPGYQLSDPHVRQPIERRTERRQHAIMMIMFVVAIGACMPLVLIFAMWLVMLAGAG